MRVLFELNGVLHVMSGPSSGELHLPSVRPLLSCFYSLPTFAS